MNLKPSTRDIDKDIVFLKEDDRGEVDMKDIWAPTARGSGGDTLFAARSIRGHLVERMRSSNVFRQIEEEPWESMCWIGNGNRSEPRGVFMHLGEGGRKLYSVPENCRFVVMGL